ncbi:MAG: NAD-dependent epimerase/dehydratase family protein [Candidatus Hodarchaeota archaeon]
MKYFITGATGFIGSHIVEYIASKNNETLSNVALFVRNPQKVKEYEKIGAIIFSGDIAELDSVTEAMSAFQPDAVIHAAALTDDWASLDELKKVNVTGTQNIIDAIKSLKAKNEVFLIYLSSSGVYGKISQPETTYITEETPFKASANYQKSKLMAEELVRGETVKKTLKAATIRPPCVMGPRDLTQSYKIYQAIKMGKFPLIDGGKAIMTWVDVQDLVEAIFLTIEQQDVTNGQAYNIRSFEVSVKELFDAFAANIDNIKPPKTYSYRLAYAAAWISEVIGKVRQKPSSLNRYRVVKFGKSRLFDASKIGELGFSPKIDKKTAIKRTLQWINAEGLA